MSNSLPKPTIRLRRATKDDFWHPNEWQLYPVWARFSDFWNYGSTLEAIHCFLTSQDLLCYALTQERKGKERTFGLACISLKDSIASIGIILRHQHLGGGMGALAIVALTEHCFSNLSVQIVQCVVSEANTKMLSIAEKILGHSGRREPQGVVFTLPYHEYTIKRNSPTEPIGMLWRRLFRNKNRDEIQN